jgi:hypothetical protein
MSRRLTVARVSVAPEQEPEYLATLRRLASLRRARGEHLWLFRHPMQPGAFLEFSERGASEPPQGGSAIDSEGPALERRLDTIASYAPGARVPWEEVQLEDG